MSFRWLKFWGDIREGMHSSWRGSIEADHARPDLLHHHRPTAAQLRNQMGVPPLWDEGLMPDNCRWAMLGEREFDLWCEAVGLLTLGDHLKRVLSVRAADRLRINLDRRMLTAIMQFVNHIRPISGAPLPLHIPTAHQLGVGALTVVCANEAPALWSRLRLRFDKCLVESIEALPSTLVYQPLLNDLSALDTALFDASDRSTARHTSSTDSQRWNQTQTLSA